MADVRTIDPDDYHDARRLFKESIGAPPDEHTDTGPLYWDLDRTLVAHDDDGHLVGVAARFDSTITLTGGQEVSCAAVPNVGVRADQQGRGLGRALLERQVREAAEDGHATMALNASETNIYGRFGYAPTSAWWSVRVDLPRVAWRADVREDPGTVRELSDDRAAAVTVARELYARAYGGWHGEVDRSEGWWARWGRKSSRDPSRPFVAVHETDGEVDCFVLYTVKFGFDDTGFANELEVHDLVGTDALVEAYLLRWLCGRRLATRLVLERCNPRTPVPHMLVDQRQWHTTALGDAVWVRVLDLPAVVGGRASLAGSGEVVVRVVDRLVAAVDGTWRIAAVDGHLTCEPTQATPQLTIPSDALGSLLWAHVSVATLARAGRITAHDADVADVADALWAWPSPAWCSTGF